MKFLKSVCFIYKIYNAIYNNKKDTTLSILNYIITKSISESINNNMPQRHTVDLQMQRQMSFKGINKSFPIYKYILQINTPCFQKWSIQKNAIIYSRNLGKY